MYLLSNREVIEISGNDSILFLQNIVTNDVTEIYQKKIIHSFLLTNKGKILFDFYLHKFEERILIDLDRNFSDELIKYLSFYKLRSDVKLEKLNSLFVYWTNQNIKHPKDPRNPDNGTRLVNYETLDKDIDKINNDYDDNRIFNSIVELGKDYNSDTIFPHELPYYINSISFKKGCFIGQEVISRVYHQKALSKKTFIRLTLTGKPQQPGKTILDSNKQVGFYGSHSSKYCLVYIDRGLSDSDISISDGELKTKK
jgi:folate-binding protein YgfZ